MTYVRKVMFKEYLHHPNAATYDSTSTADLIGSTTDDWTIAYDITTGGQVSAANVGTSIYLTNYDAYTLEDQMIFEIAVKGSVITGTSESGIGMLFMADDTADAFTNAYRLRQTDTTVYIEKTVDGGSNWTEIGSAVLAASTATTYHYRIYYTKTTLDFYGISGEFEAGNFQVYRSTAQITVNNTLVLECNDGTPLTAGGFAGPYSGESAIAIADYFGAYRLWELSISRVTYTHEIDEVSQSEIAMERDPDQVLERFFFTDRVEIWNPESNKTSGTKYLKIVFDGEVKKIPYSKRTSKVKLEGFGMELKELTWQDGSALNGTIESELQDILPTIGGTGAFSASTSTTYVLHRNNISITSQTTERVVSGASSEVEVKKMLKEDGAWMFYHPDGRFFIRNTLVSTYSLELDSTNEDENIENIDYYTDGSQMVNKVDGYHNNWVAPNVSQDATSQTAYGNRSVPLIDMKAQNSVISANAGAEIVEEYKDLRRIAEIKVVQARFEIFPGFRIDSILAGTDIGTNATGGVPDTDTGNWVAESCTCTKVTYDSLTGTNRIYLVKNDQGAADNHVRRKVDGVRNLGTSLKNLYSLDV